ncbi:MAG: epoxide hydrolase family protein [Terriglobales bacterium]
MRPFHSRADKAALDDLRLRLHATRWPPALSADWTYGFPVPELQEICRYWADEFDWRRAEAAMFAWPHFQIEIGGFCIHFVHIRSQRAGAPALVLTHGWPGSFLELLPLAPLLPDFDLVIPSLPGFAFSPHPGTPGCDTAVIAGLWASLMTALGYDRFGVHGGDIGASVSTLLGSQYPERILGVHLNYLPGAYYPELASTEPITAAEEAFLAEKALWANAQGGYEHLQRTQPQTLSYGLNDSPAALAAWMLDRFRNWSDCDGQLTPYFQIDDLLANVALYWLTGSTASSFRLYTERWPAFAPVRVPCAFARFPREISLPPRSWVERGYHIVRWTEMPRGGHFAAWEQPALLATDLREFFACD